MKYNAQERSSYQVAFKMHIIGRAYSATLPLPYVGAGWTLTMFRAIRLTHGRHLMRLVRARSFVRADPGPILNGTWYEGYLPILRFFTTCDYCFHPIPSRSEKCDIPFQSRRDWFPGKKPLSPKARAPLPPPGFLFFACALNLKVIRVALVRTVDLFYS